MKIQTGANGYRFFTREKNAPGPEVSCPFRLDYKQNKPQQAIDGSHPAMSCA
jgi:hypothetical protein